MARNRPPPATNDRTRGVRVYFSWLLILSAVLFVLSRVYILLVLEPQITDVESTYFAYAIRAYDAHLAPYTEQLPIEYPPIAWWLMYAPRWLDSQHIIEPSQLDPALKEYSQAFRGLMFLCDLGSAALLISIVNRRRPELLGWAALTYTVTTTILCHLLYDRLDTALLTMILGWAFCWLCSLESPNRAGVWSAVGYVILGLSIGFKLIPVICVPFLVLADWRGPQRTARLSVGLAALTVATGLPFLIQYAISGPGVFALLKYHGERRIQIESLYSTFMMIGSLFGCPIFVVKSHAAFDLEGRLANLMTAISNVLMYGFLAGTWLCAFFRRASYKGQDAYRAACFVLAGAVIFSKVLSPQYFLWAIPLTLLLAVDVCPRGSISIWGLATLLVATTVLTTWLFPFHYCNSPGHPGLLPMDSSDPSILLPAPCIVLGIRNLIYLGIVLWLGWALFHHSDRPATNNG
jgi:hypothetical protein